MRHARTLHSTRWIGHLNPNCVSDLFSAFVRESFPSPHSGLSVRWVLRQLWWVRFRVAWTEISTYSGVWSQIFHCHLISSFWLCAASTVRDVHSLCDGVMCDE